MSHFVSSLCFNTLLFTCVISSTLFLRTPIFKLVVIFSMAGHENTTAKFKHTIIQQLESLAVTRQTFCSANKVNYRVLKINNQLLFSQEKQNMYSTKKLRRHLRILKQLFEKFLVLHSCHI